MLHRPDTKAVEAIVVVGGIDSSAIEVQVVAVRLRVERRTPVVAVGAPVVETRPVAVARRGEVRQTYFFWSVLKNLQQSGRCTVPRMGSVVT